MKKKKIVALIAGLCIIAISIILVLKLTDPQARAIRQAKNYTPTGNEAKCTQSVTPAIHTKSGAKYTFPDGCLPPGWFGIPQPSSPVNTKSFDIEAFYSKLQIGMSVSQVVEVAGRQPDDCSYTDSEPPSTTCYWTSGAKATTVNYGKTNVVQTKHKSGF